MKLFLSIIAALVLAVSPSLADAQVMNLNQISSSTQRSPYYGVIMGDGVGAHKATASSSPTVWSIQATGTVASFLRFASSTALSAINFCVSSDCINDLTGSGLSISGGALNVSGLTTANFSSANISQWTNNVPYLTSLSGAASSTLLGDSNTWSGNNLFNASTTFTKVVNMQNASSSLNTFATVWNTGITSALILVDGNHKETAYAGASDPCSNQVPTTISATGVLGGCLSINNAWWSGTQLSVANGGTNDTSLTGDRFLYTNHAGDTVLTAASSSLNLPNSALANSTISGVALGGSLFAHTVSGSITGTSYNGSAAVSDWTLNMANANSWTALQNFKAASSTTFSVFSSFAAGATATDTINGVGDLLVVGSTTLQNFTGVNATTSRATTTSFAITSVTSALHLANSTGGVIPYGGASACAGNNFVTTISAVGGTTCGTAAISGVNLGSNLNAHTVSGSITGTSYNGSAAVSDWTLNMANANSWTALQNFKAASSTTFSVFSSFAVGATATDTINGVGDLQVMGSTSLQNFTAVKATTTAATTTSFAVTSVTSALHLANSTGGVIAYGGSNPCTNQVALSVSASGVVGCTTVTNAMLTNQGVTINTGVGLSGGGTVNLGGSLTLTDTNFVWGNFFSTSSAATTTSLHTVGIFTASSTVAASQFPYASTTAISSTNASSTFYFGAGLDAGCNGSSFLQFTSGRFGCAVPAGTGALPGVTWALDAAGQLAPTTTLAVSIPTWLSRNDQTMAFVDATNHATIFGLLAGGNVPTTSATVLDTTAIGYQALAKSATNGFENTAVGSFALAANTAGDRNTAVGYQALMSVSNGGSNGGDNTAVGSGALSAVTDSSGPNFTAKTNTAVGSAAMNVLVNGTNNIAVGFDALGGTFTGPGIQNTVMGAQAVGQIVGGDDNTILGYLAAEGSGSGSIYRNVMVGSTIATAIADGGNENTLVGYQTGGNVTSGYGNTIVGALEATISTGKNNVGLGPYLVFPSGTANSQLNIGNLIFGKLPATSTSLVTGSVGTVGIASTTPWGEFSIAANSFDYQHPILAIATSSDPYGNIFFLTATSSQLASLQNPHSLVLDSGARAAVGTTRSYDYPGLLDQFTVNGRINTGDWYSVQCGIEGMATGVISANTTGACGGWAFQFDSQGRILNTAQNGLMVHHICDNSSTFGDDCTSSVALQTANSGAGIFAANGHSAANASLVFATSTPVIEATVQISNSKNATSTSFYVGFTNLNVVGTTYETEPTAGCYFVASSTRTNWATVARVDASNATMVDTGFATTTVLTTGTGGGGFTRMRLEADNIGCKFYMATSGAPLRIVANTTTNVPKTVAVSAGVYMANTTGSFTTQFDVNTAKLWARQPALNY